MQISGFACQRVIQVVSTGCYHSWEHWLDFFFFPHTQITTSTNFPTQLTFVISCKDASWTTLETLSFDPLPLSKWWQTIKLSASFILFVPCGSFSCRCYNVFYGIPSMSSNYYFPQIVSLEISHDSVSATWILLCPTLFCCCSFAIFSKCKTSE